MDRMRLKRLLTICLALMLSVSMLPAGTFALTEAGAASDQNQTDTASEGVLDNRESDPNDEGNKGSDINQNDDVNQSPDMTFDPADDQNNNDSDSNDQDVKKDSVNDPDADSKLTKGDESKGATDSTSLEVTFNDVPLPMQETYSMRADDQVTMVITATMPSTAGEKTITIDIPTGWAIMGCSALDSDELPVIDLSKAAIMDPRLNSIIVGRVKVDPIYIPQLKGMTIDPVTSAGIDSAYGTVTGDTWESQFLEGYDGVSNAHTLGGRLTYTLDDNAQNMQLIVRLLPQPFIFSREGSDTSEVMPPVVTTLSVKKNGSEDAEVKELSSENNVTATNIPRVRGVAQQPVTFNEIIPVDDDRVHMSIQGGISQWNGATQNSTWYSLTDEYTYTITYPPGVFYSEDQTGGQDSQGKPLKQIIPQGSEITVDEDPVNGGGTVTITGKNYTLKHNSTEFRLYFDAKGYNENVDSFHPGCSKVWAKSEDPETLTITANAEFKRLGTTVTTDNINWKRTIYRPADGDSYAIKIGETDIVRRDLVDDFGLDRYDIKLAHTSLESSFVYEDVPFHFVNQDNRLGITGFRMVGKDIKDIEIKTFYADGRPGRTIPRIDGPYGTGFPQSDTNGSYMIAGGEIGLNPGEYISEVNLRADIDQKKYGTGNLGCGIGFIGQFLQDRSDEEKAGHVDVAIVHYEDGKYVNTPAKSSVANDPETGEPLDVTGYAAVTVGMDVIGCGSCPTTVSKSQDGVNATDPTWYPNQVVYIKSTLDSSWAIHEQDSLINPEITIALPEGLVLNNDSVKGQSLAGNHRDDSWFDLKFVGSRQIEVDGVTWNCYDYTSVNPLDMVASESRTNVGNFGGTVTNGETRMSIRFEAYVASNCHPYSLDVADCVLWYVGDNVKNGNGGSPAISKDVDNRMGRGTDAIAAHGSKKFYIKPLIGLVTDLAIRADESPDADWMTWAGGDNTVANVHEGQPAQVKLSYESTADSVNFNDSVFYLPIPKKDAVYDYLNNAELASPMDVADPRTFGFTASLKGPVTMQGGETKWTTYYAVSAKSADTVYDSTAPDSDKWEPVSPVDPDTWLTEDEITDWSDVVMVKFHADGPIPPGEKGQALFTMDIDPDAEFGTYDYWRSYGKARLGDSKDQWMYTPVIAATPTSATLLGQLFIDDNMNTAFDEDSEQGYGTNFTAVLTKDDASTAPMDVTVDTDGSMKLLDTEGRQIYLRKGDYTLTVTKSDDETVYDYEKVESDTKSSAEKWYNDIKNNKLSGNIATYNFTVDKSVEKVDDAYNAVVYYAGVGLIKMNDFSFTKLGEVKSDSGAATLEPLEGAEFTLYTDAECTTQAERLGTAYEATSDSAGKVEFKELVAGTYYMKETALPSGTEDTYFANNTTYRVVVDNEGKAELTRAVVDPDTGETQGDEKAGYSIVNRQKTSIEGIKIWNDGNETRPNITIILTKMIGDVKETAEYVVGIKEGEGVDIVADPDPDDSSKWSFTISDLAAFDENGNPILYSIAEDVLEGYIATQEGNTITNTKTTEAIVKKVWLDGNDAAGMRPDELTFTLQQKTGSGEPSAVKDKEGNDVTVTLPSEGKWEASVKDLPKYGEDGAEITYSWTEPDVTGYELTDTSVSGTVTTFTNTILTEATVKKVWVDADDAAELRPASLKVTLMNGTTSVSEVMLDEEGGWEDTITDLPKYNAQGEEITYTWSEAADMLPDGYELTGTDKKGTVTTLTNTLVPHKVKITKTFKGIDEASLPADFSIAAAYTEYVKGKGTAGKAATKELKLTDTDAEKSDDGLTYTWTIENVCYGSEFTATEAGYELKSYRHEGKVAASDTEAAGTEVVVTDESASGTIDKVPATDDAHIDFTNKYTHSDLWIYKTLPEYVQLDADNEENVHASFAFRIVGYKDEDCTQESGFNTVKGIEFDSASETEGKAFIGKIPKDVVAVKITEISMSGYEPNGDSTVIATRTVDADDNWIFRAEFANKRTGTPYESGVVNKYRKEGDTYAKGAAEIPEEPKEIVPPEEDRR